MIDTTPKSRLIYAQVYGALFALSTVGSEQAYFGDKYSDVYDETRVGTVSSTAPSVAWADDVFQAKLEQFATQWNAIVEQLVPQDAIVTLSTPGVSGVAGLFLSNQALALYESIDTLEKYRALKAGWNGKGSTPFDVELIDNAIDFVKQLDYQPEIFPTGRDSIQFEYHTEWGYLEVEMDRYGISMLIERHGQAKEYDSVSTDEAITKIREFHAQRHHT